MSADTANALQVIEHLANQIDRLGGMLEEEVAMLTRAGAASSTVDRHAAELKRLQGERAQFREMIVRFWTEIGTTDAQ